MKNEKKTIYGFWSPRRIFYFPKPDTKRICMIALLIAITFVLSAVSGYIRIGNISKLTVSFVSVFVAAYAFGPVAGGVVGAAADIVSFAVNPTGMFMPQLTLIEFFFGFMYGFFFFGRGQKLYYLNVVLYDIIQFAVNIFIKTAMLSAVFGIEYKANMIMRLPMCVIQAVIVAVVLILIKPFMESFLKKTGMTLSEKQVRK